MTALDGKIVKVELLSEGQKRRMFSLMDEFYENMAWEVFESDLLKKDYCIILYDKNNVIQGFSTQQIISVVLPEKTVYGVFSGDTIVHKNFWATRHPLFSIFANFFEEYSRDYEDFYWFLICKGYKTYKILPTFFNEFYPNCSATTPEYEQKIMHAFGKSYSKDYNEKSGVIEYSATKDKLKLGVADIDERQLKNKHTAFFVKQNPFHTAGHDMVCITSLHKHNYQKNKEAILWG